MANAVVTKTTAVAAVSKATIAEGAAMASNRSNHAIPVTKAASRNPVKASTVAEAAVVVVAVDAAVTGAKTVVVIAEARIRVPKASKVAAPSEPRPSLTLANARGSPRILKASVPLPGGAGAFFVARHTDASAKADRFALKIHFTVRTGSLFLALRTQLHAHG